MRMRNENPILRQSEKANYLGYYSLTSQRYRSNINMLSPHRFHPKTNNKRRKKASNTNFDDNSHRDLDVQRPQLTSIDLKTTQTNTRENVKHTSNKRNKNSLKGESVHENENNDGYLNEIFHKNDFVNGISDANYF